MKNARAANSIEVRDAVKTDSHRLLSMVGALAMHHNDIPEISMEALERDVFGEIPWVYILVLEVDEKIVGYSTLAPLIHFEAGVRGIDMHHLFIEKEFRGVGMGRYLIEASIQKARDLSCAYMKVGAHPENINAQAVYLACGFEQRFGSNPKFHISIDG